MKSGVKGQYDARRSFLAKQPPNFKKMTNQQLLDCKDPRAVNAIREKIMRKPTMVRFLQQHLEEFNKEKTKNEGKEKKKPEVSDVDSIKTDDVPLEDDTFGEDKKEEAKAAIAQTIASQCLDFVSLL